MYDCMFKWWEFKHVSANLKHIYICEHDLTIHQWCWSHRKEKKKSLLCPSFFFRMLYHIHILDRLGSAFSVGGNLPQYWLYLGCRQRQRSHANGPATLVLASFILLPYKQQVNCFPFLFDQVTGQFNFFLSAVVRIYCLFMERYLDQSLITEVNQSCGG